MFPTKIQWKKWSLPSKYTTIGLALTILSLGLYFKDQVITYIDNQQFTESTKELFNTEKNKNLKILKFLSKNLSGEELQKVIYEIDLLSTESLNNNNNHTNIQQFMELKNILNFINNKIKALKDANANMLIGNLSNMQKAIINFTNVKYKAQKAILLYSAIKTD